MPRFLLFLFAVCILLTDESDFAASAQHPNILLILADDMGYGDLSCLGSKTVQTPQLDRLAEQGVLCTQAYVASAVCSPSRAGLITGRDPRRFGYEGNLNNNAEKYAANPQLLGLPVGEHTLADHLQAAGYDTGLVGKWHLGNTDQFYPTNRGFDYFCGMRGGGHDYFPSAENNKIERNGARVQSFSSSYLTDFFTDEAVRWIGGKTRPSKQAPWFLYLSYNAPHTPMQATEEDLVACESVMDEKRRTYAAMMRALDRGIGRVIDALEKTEQLDNTLVVFFSDNGGATNNGSWNGPLSGAKGTLLEGGVRVPMIWSWPGQISASRIDDTPMSSLDLLPTFLSAAGTEPLPLTAPPPYHDRNNAKRTVGRYGAYDGIDLLPLLRQSGKTPSRSLFWRLQGQAVLLKDQLKLIRLSHRPAQLFDVAVDRGEQHDLATERPQELRNYFAELGAWEASLPTVPIWDSSPFWHGDSAQIYDNWQPRIEPH